MYLYCNRADNSLKSYAKVRVFFLHVSRSNKSRDVFPNGRFWTSAYNSSRRRPVDLINGVAIVLGVHCTHPTLWIAYPWLKLPHREIEDKCSRTRAFSKCEFKKCIKMHFQLRTLMPYICLPNGFTYYCGNRVE